MLREEIRTKFANSDVDSAYRLDNLPKEYPAYVVRYLNSYCVAIPYDGAEVNEEFANAQLKTGIIKEADGTQRQGLFLMSSITETRNEFAVFCEDFVTPGQDGSKRKELLKNPVEWWKNWRRLIGNAIMEKRPYAILGELLMYEYLLKNGKNVQWGGPQAASHDLVCKNEEYEVKSTVERYQSIIHIAGQFQLQKEKALKLFFCRFEENVNGICIDDVVERIVSKSGISIDEINGKLSLQGYAPGTSYRKEKYQVHEVMAYKVDDKFPKITLESFAGGKMPAGITHLEYNVDLSVLDGEKIDL